MIAAAIAVIAIGVLYAVALEPAWFMRARVLRLMPQLQEELAHVQSLREEVRLLRQQGFGTQSLDALRNAAQSSLERASIVAAIRTEGERTMVLSASSVAATRWFAWMEQFTREARVRVVYARVARTGSDSTLQAEAAFEIPAR
jgi:type II secretory pathway component PulM